LEEEEERGGSLFLSLFFFTLLLFFFGVGSFVSKTFWHSFLLNAAKKKPCRVIEVKKSLIVQLSNESQSFYL